jgi:hypothetical protein
LQFMSAALTCLSMPQELLCFQVLLVNISNMVLKQILLVSLMDFKQTSGFSGDYIRRTHTEHFKLQFATTLRRQSRQCGQRSHRRPSKAWKYQTIFPLERGIKYPNLGRKNNKSLRKYQFILIKVRWKLSFKHARVVNSFSHLQPEYLSASFLYCSKCSFVMGYPLSNDSCRMSIKLTTSGHTGQSDQSAK